MSAWPRPPDKNLVWWVGDDVGVAEVAGWAQEFSRVEALLGPRFGRWEPRARAVGYVRSLMAPLERKNGWTISEATGARSPDSVQWLLTGADWDPDLLRDDLRDWVVDQLGDPGGVLIVDDTGFLKKGTKSAGVQRQYSGTAGRIENCQIGVFLAYATPAGRTLLDRELYLPGLLDRGPGTLRRGRRRRRGRVRDQARAGRDDAPPRARRRGCPRRG